MKSYRLNNLLVNGAIYAILIGFALIMLFPFVYMLTTSLKLPADTFRYPPRLLPRDPTTVQVAGFDEPLPLYYVPHEGQRKQFALARSNIKVGIYADP
ncbi:MAG: hypothetical protein M3Q45_07775, partial [Chloroflexota bacterium]|nr:hypothetical protein [Chloroflexota bacterium]